MKKAIRARQFMYTQDLDHLPFKKEDLKTLLEKSSAEEWAYILHDKDIGKKWKNYQTSFSCSYEV